MSDLPDNLVACELFHRDTIEDKTLEQLRAQISSLSHRLSRSQARETRYRCLLEDSPNPVCFTDEAAVITFVNTSFCNLVLRDRVQVLGKCFFQLMPAEQRNQIRSDFESLTQEKPLRLCPPQVYGVEGFRFWERWSVRAFFDESGQLIGYQALGQDISEHRELEKQTLRTDLIVSRSPLILFEGKHSKGIPLLYVSENISQFGYSARALMESKTTLASLIHPEDPSPTLQFAERDDRTGSPEREYTYRLRNSGGHYRWVNQKSRIIAGEEGKPDTLVGILMDVTEQKAADQAISESHKTLEQQVTRLENAWEQTIGLLAAITELRDPYTMGHQRRVAHLSGAIAREIGWDEKQAQETVRAALVHDIGKIQIPSDFLSKPGKLTSTEFALIREHAQVGADLLAKIDLPWQLSRIVAQHHERLDGSGYPKGLKSMEILPAAKIIAVADVVEAMASHRPYRPALGIGKALEEISAQAGRLYDHDTVYACRYLFLEKGYNWIDN